MSTRNEPSISIVIPVFNSTPEQLDMAVSSAMTQFLSDYEIVLVDDGSTHADTLRVIETYEVMTRSGRLGRSARVIRMGSNRGQAEARNAAVLSSRAEVIAFLDADDCYFESSLITRAARMKYGNLDMVWTPFIYRELDPKGNVKRTSPVRYDLTCASVQHSYDKEEAFEVLQHRNITVPLTAMVRRSTFLKVGGFEPGLVCGEDHLLWRRIMELPDSRVEFFDEPTGWYQSWGDGVHQSRVLHMPAEGGFHLNTDHPAGKSGEYLDEKANARATQWVKEMSDAERV